TTMSYSTVAVPRPSRVAVPKTRFAFTEKDAFVLQEKMGGRKLRPGATLAELAARLAQCTREHLIFHAVDHGVTTAQGTADWCDQFSRVLDQLCATVTPIATDLDGARRALLLDETAATATRDFLTRWPPIMTMLPDAALEILSSSAVVQAAAAMARQ